MLFEGFPGLLDPPGQEVLLTARFAQLTHRAVVPPFGLREDGLARALECFCCVLSADDAGNVAARVEPCFEHPVLVLPVLDHSGEGARQVLAPVGISRKVEEKLARLLLGIAIKEGHEDGPIQRGACEVCGCLDHRRGVGREAGSIAAERQRTEAVVVAGKADYLFRRLLLRRTARDHDEDVPP